MMYRLPPRPPDCVPVLVDGPLSAVHRVWRLRPEQDTLVVIVRAVGHIGLDGAVALRDQPPAPRGELHRDDDTVASLLRASEIGPFKPRADITLVGHAYPARPPAPTAHVQLAFGSQRVRIAAIGDRQWQGGRPSEPAPFERMPLNWERAFGGPGHAVNPVGVGLKGDRLPNLERPDALLRSRRDRPEPACFAPLTRTWPARARLLGSYDRHWLEERWPYFPADMDWGYFNAAPAALQLAYPRGDERFDLAGVHPDAQVLSGRLPGLGPRAYALHRGSSEQPLGEIALCLDTVAFDADALEVALVWRGLLDISSAQAPEIEALLVCGAGLEQRFEQADARARLEQLLVARHGPEVLPGGDGAPTGSSGASADRAAVGEPPPEPLPGPLPEPPLLARDEALSLIASGAVLAGLSFAGCDLHDVDLSGRDLRAAHFTGADLSGASLVQADLSGAVLARVRAAGAKLNGAKLMGANLSEALLAGAELERADLRGASLTEVRAAGAHFDSAELGAAQFVDADLADASFDGASARAADLSSARLTGSSFRGAVLDDAQLYDCAARGACFDGASLERLRADGADLSEASFGEARAPGASFISATLLDASLGGACLDDADLSHARLDRAKLTSASAKSASFRSACLEGLRAASANLMEACLQGADLTGADLRGANLYGADTWKAKLVNVRLEGALLAGSKLAR